MLKKLAKGEAQVVHVSVDFKCAIPHFTPKGDKKFVARRREMNGVLFFCSHFELGS